MRCAPRAACTLPASAPIWLSFPGINAFWQPMARNSPTEAKSASRRQPLSRPVDFACGNSGADLHPTQRTPGCWPPTLRAGGWLARALSTAPEPHYRVVAAQVQQHAVPLLRCRRLRASRQQHRPFSEDRENSRRANPCPNRKRSPSRMDPLVSVSRGRKVEETAGRC
jgi:hypothetical protein